MRQSGTFRTLVRASALILTASLLSLALVPAATAGIVSTEAAMAMEERTARIERINSVLARDNVRDQMIRLGVDPQDAAARLAALSDSELQQLETRMEKLPAGADGALEVLGIVMLVLLVLELVGITDVFKSI